MAGVVPLEIAIDLRVLSMHLCFSYQRKGQSEVAKDAIGSRLTYSASEMPTKIFLQMVDPKTGKVEAIDKKITLTMKRSTSSDTVNIKVSGGVSLDLASHICPSISSAPGIYMAVSDDGSLQASLNIEILPTAPANLLVRNATKDLTLKMGTKFQIGFDVLDSRGVVYSDASNLKILMQSSDGSIEFDPPPDDEDGTYEIHRSSPDSKSGLFYLESALVGRLPPAQKVNLTLILQGRQNIKRSIVAHLEAGEATRFVFADAASGTALGDDTTFEYTSGQELGLRLLAVDDSGNKVAAFSGQKALVTLRAVGGGNGTGGGGGVDLHKEIQVDMVKGEGNLSSDRWFVALASPSAQAEVSVRAARNAGLRGSALLFPVKPGNWLSEVQLSVNFHKIDALSHEMAADQKTLDLTVKALTQNNQVYSGEYSLSLRPSASRMQVDTFAAIVSGGAKGSKTIQGLAIPVAPGIYDVNLIAQAPNVPPVNCTLTVTRAQGEVSEVQLKGPSKLCTQAKKEFVLAVSTSNALGGQLAPELWQGHLTFLVSEGRLKIVIANAPTSAASAATTATYTISLDDDGDIEDDVIVSIWAVVGRKEAGADEATIEIKSNIINEFKYIPRARIEKETEKVKRKRKEEEELVEQLSVFDVLIEDHRLAEAAVQDATSSLTKELGRVAAVFLPSMSDSEDSSAVLQALNELLDEKNRDVQQLLEQVHWTEPDLQVRRNAALDSYMRRRAQDASYGGVPLVGILGELASVADAELASAVSVLLDDELQAIVVNTEDEVEELRAFCIKESLGSLKIISLESASRAQVQESREREQAKANNHDASLAYDVIKVRGTDDLVPARQQLWWHVLQGAVIFKSEESLQSYRKEFGRTAAFACPLPDNVPGWRVDGRFFSQVGISQTTARYEMCCIQIL